MQWWAEKLRTLMRTNVIGKRLPQGAEWGAGNQKGAIVDCFRWSGLCGSGMAR
tara:strand:+ start:554 stop:712 length:159 start_codon:yes stop_codon:yes gene_type:complete